MKVSKRLANGGLAVLLAASSFATMGFGGVAHATPNTCVWTGATNTSMATAGNWTGCGGAPQAGDIIKFDTLVPTASPVSLTNNLGVALGGVIADQVSDADGTHHGTITIDTITLADGASISEQAFVDCDHHAENLLINAVTSSGSITDNTGSATKNATLTISGDYTTTSGYIAAGSGSTIGGDITIESPIATGDCSSGGAGVAASGSSITGVTINGLTVQKGASVNLADADFPITLGGGSGTNEPAVYFYADEDGDSAYIATTRAVSSDITLLSDASFEVEQKTTVNVTGNITGNGFKLTRSLTSDHSGVLNIDPASNSSDTEEGKLVNPIITTTVSDSQPSVNLVVVDGDTTVLDGERGSVYVYGGGTLKGSGTAASVTIADGGTLAPGHSPGKLTVTSTLHMNAGSTYQAELKNKTAGNFDQVVVGNAADTVGNDVTVNGAALAVSLYSGADIKSGDTFTIIDNLSQTAVSGTFDSLPEGATFKVGNGTMKMSYVGGDGNDVVLTAMSAISAPDTGFALVTAHPVVTLAVAVLAAGVIFGVARKVSPVRIRARR